MGFVEYKSTKIPPIEPFTYRTGSSSLKFKGFQNLRMNFHDFVLLIVAFGYTTVSGVGASNNSEDYCKLAANIVANLSVALTSVYNVDERVATLNEDFQRLQGDNIVLCQTIGAKMLGTALLASTRNEALKAVGQKCMPENNLKLLLDLEESTGRRLPLLWDFFIVDQEHRFSLGCIIRFTRLISTEDNRVQLYAQLLEIMSLEIAKNHSAWGDVMVRLAHDLHKYPDLAELQSSVPAGINKVFMQRKKSIESLNVGGWLTISSRGCGESSSVSVCHVSGRTTNTTSCHQEPAKCMKSQQGVRRPKQWKFDPLENGKFFVLIHESRRTLGRSNESRTQNDLQSTPYPPAENFEERSYHWKIVPKIEADQTVNYRFVNRASPGDMLCAHDCGSVTIESISDPTENDRRSCLWKIS